jgi:hypothetical protein
VHMALDVTNVEFLKRNRIQDLGFTAVVNISQVISSVPESVLQIIGD